MSATTTNGNKGGRPRAELTPEQEQAILEVQDARKDWLADLATAEESERVYLRKLAAAKGTGLGAKRLAPKLEVSPGTVRNHLAKAGRP